MKKPVAPCRNCAKRSVGCKSECLTWKIHESKWKKWTAIVKAEKKKSKTIAIHKGRKDVIH